MVKRHKKGKQRNRGIDLIAQMFGELVNAMTRTDADILGDLFQGSVTYGESGQYFSPESIAELLAKMSVDPDARPTRDQPLLVSDCCCGTGILLMEAGKISPNSELVGQDIDPRMA
jgi:type I restriction-modification system DNA methylase subunit